MSEVSYRVGFGNTSYFIKCFRELYGFSPREAGKVTKVDDPLLVKEYSLGKYAWFIFSAMALIVIAGLFFVLKDKKATSGKTNIEKSIAVLPFKNESNDSANLYFVNGLMESTLNNLQKIGDLRVISRTSTEKYRTTDKSIPEIAEELGVNYLVEGSGQRIGDQVLLNIQLIEASADRPVWGEQYSREVGDVFALQNEVARKIAAAIEAVVTPAELQRIDKIPTENMEAWEFYLQGLDSLYIGTDEGLQKAIGLFGQAIEMDGQFALAYANTAIAYFYIDMYKSEKLYTEQINNFSDKALLYDSKSDVSLISKALYYIQTGEYTLAIPHLTKALEYNPNSSAVVQMLADLYARVIPNTGKYLEYALKGIQLNIAASDSINKSYIYLHLSNALVQNGFVDEAVTYINKSLDYEPENYYAPMLKAFILFARDGDLELTRKRLLMEWEKDTSRLDILQEVAKSYYFQENYDSAFHYYQQFVAARERGGLNIYPHEDVKLSLVWKKKGLNEQAEKFFQAYSEYCEQDQSIYRSASLSVKHAYLGEYDTAITHLKDFATQEDFQYWYLLFLEADPLMKPLKKHPEFDLTVRKIEKRFWDKHKRLKELLGEKELI